MEENMPVPEPIDDRLKNAVRARLAALDRTLEHRVRLAVAVLLAPGRPLSFTALKDLTGETDGSLGAHLKRLVEESFLRVDRSFVTGRPLSRYTLTPHGLSALERHLDALEGLLGEALAEDRGNVPGPAG
jgi:DNA-binding MarR family transcriptional regulator